MRDQSATARFGAPEWGLSTVLALTWGSSFLLISIAIEHLDPGVIPVGRSLMGAAALFFFPGARTSIPWRHWARIALLGLVWMAIPFLLFPLAEQTVASSVAGMMNGGLPVVIAAVTALWVRRMPSGRRIVAIVIGFIGIVVVALPSVRHDAAEQSIADARGILLLTLALLGYAIGSNIARPLQALYSPARLLMRVQFTAAIWMLPVGAAGISRSDFDWRSLLALVVLGVMGTGVAFVAFGVLLERTGITRAMIPTYFTPIVGLFLGVLVNAESIAPISLIGMVVVIASAWMMSRPDERDVMLSDATRAR